MTVRKAYVNLLKSLLLVGLFIGCDPKEEPSGPTKVYVEVPPKVSSDVRLGVEVPLRPETLS